MSTNVTLNGNVYTIPAEGDDSWGPSVSAYLIAVASGVLQKTGGNFTLTSEIDFGATYGIKAAYFTSKGTNPSSSGVLRLANNESVKWRNAANNADIGLTVDGTDTLLFGGVPFLTGLITNANVASGAGIVYSKLDLTNGIVNADINSSAAIAYSKLNLSGGIVNADIANIAAIVYSKLNLANSIVNADIAAGAGIAYAKLSIADGDLTIAKTANLQTTLDSKVTPAGAQTLTNKDFDGGTASNTNRLTVPKNTKANLDGLTRKQATLVYSTDQSKLYVDDGSTLKAVGSGSGGLKNYLTSIVTSQSTTPNTGNGDFELGATTGWSKGTIGTLTNGLPTGTPTFGSGSNANLSISVVSSSQIAGSYSLSYASSSATTQGNMLASDAFYIDTEDQAKVLTYQIAVKAQSGASTANWSGTSSNSFGFAVYDVTNSTWLQVSNPFGFIQSSGVGIVNGSFQTNYNTTQLRVVVYNVNATSGAITLYFDDISVSPGDNPNLNAVPVLRVRRSASQSIATGTITAVAWDVVQRDTAGAFSLGSSAYTVPSSGDYRISACVTWDANSTNGRELYFRVNGSNVANLAYTFGPSAVGGCVLTGSINYTLNAGDSIGIGVFQNSGGALNVGAGGSAGNYFTLEKIVASSPDGYEGRFIGARYGSSTTGAMAAATDIVVNYATQAGYDTTASVTTGVSWNFRVPSSGYYKVHAGHFFSISGAGTVGLKVRKNGTVIKATTYPANTATSNITIDVTATHFFNAGDTIDIVGNSNNGAGSFASDVFVNIVTIEKVQAPSAVQSGEVVAARYTGVPAGTPAGTHTTVTYPTRAFDTHAAYSGGVYSCPTSGYFHVDATIEVSGTESLGNIANVAVYVNNVPSLFGISPRAPGSVANTHSAVNGLVYMNAGDQLTIKVYTDITGPSFTSADVTPGFHIFKIK